MRPLCALTRRRSSDKLFARVAKSSAIRSNRWPIIAGAARVSFPILENGKQTIQFGKALGVASMLGLDLSIRRERRGAMSESLKVLQGGVLVGALDKGNSEPFYGFTYDEA